ARTITRSAVYPKGADMWLAIGRLVFAALIGALMQATQAQEGEGAGAARARTPSASPDARKFIAPADQVMVIRAARMFDARSGKMIPNPVIVVRGDRIAEVGTGGTVPAGATLIDLGSATLLPAMIDEHLHLNLNQPRPPARRALTAP